MTKVLGDTRRPPALGVAVVAILLSACGEPAKEKPAPETGCAPGTVALEGGECAPAGQPQGEPGACGPGSWAPVPGGECQSAGLPAVGLPCPAGEAPGAGGECVAAGVPPEACGEGFSPSMGGCEPVLPAAPCPEGQLAVPGETDCHEVAPCGAAPYGDAPVDAATQFVDNAYPGADSDGSAAKPWTSVQAGIDAAAPGALVAVAAGTYAEDVVIADKAVRLWGRCPSLVTIAGAATALAISGVSGAEVHGVGLTSAGVGARVAGAQAVALQGVWVHGTGEEGIVVTTSGATPSVDVAIEESLVESAGIAGIAVDRSTAALRRSVVRGAADPGFGVVATTASKSAVAGLTVERCVIEDNGYDGVHLSASTASIASSVVRANTNAEVYVENNGHLRGAVTMTGSVVEKADLAGIYAIGSELTVTASVVRDDASGDGWGIYLDRDGGVSEAATGTITASLLDNNHGTGIAIYGSAATVAATAVRDTQMEGKIAGVGIAVIGGKDGGTRASLAVSGSEVSKSHLAGILILGSDATIEGTRVSGTQGILDKGDAFFLGPGIEMTPDEKGAERSVVTITGSVVADNHEAGVVVNGSDCTIESTEIRGTLAQPKDGLLGRGIQVQVGPSLGRANLTVRASVVADNKDVGVFVGGSDALLEEVVVEGTAPPEGDLAFGTGVNAELDIDSLERAKVTVRGSVIAESHSAGLLVRGATAVVEDTLIQGTLATAETEMWGRGVLAADEETTGQRADLTLLGSRVENSLGMGVGVYGSDALIEATEIRGTGPNPADGSAGNGLQVWNRTATQNRAVAKVHRSWIADNRTTGVLNGGGDVELLGVLVEGTLPELSTGFFGRGVSAQRDPDLGLRASLVVRDCRVTGNRDVGIFVAGSDADVSHTLVEATTPREKDGLFGDGVVALAYGEPAAMAVKESLITGSGRAGLASFGSALSLASTRIACAAFELEADDYGGEEPALKDLGDNLCGCPEAESECHAASSGLSPPDHDEASGGE